MNAENKRGANGPNARLKGILMALLLLGAVYSLWQERASFEQLMVVVEADDDLQPLGNHLSPSKEAWPLPPRGEAPELHEVSIHRDVRKGFFGSETPQVFDLQLPKSGHLELAFAIMQRVNERLEAPVMGRAQLRNGAGEILASHRFPIETIYEKNRNWHEWQLDLAPLNGASAQLELWVEGLRPYAQADDPHEIGVVWEVPRYSQGKKKDRPNIVMISLDTLRADRLNTYGYEARQTSPHMDALAQGGVVFDYAMANAPWTSPSHMSMLTGRYPSTFRVRFQFNPGTRSPLDLFSIRNPEIKTLSTVLKAEGYRTAAFTGGGYMGSALGFARGFERFVARNQRLNAPFTEEPLAWIEAHQNENFFLFFHTFEVHAAYLNDDFIPEVTDKKGQGVVAKIISEIKALDTYPGERLSGVLTLRYMSSQLRKAGLFELDVTSALYDGGVLSADAYVGRILQKLDDLGLSENTLVILTSDHGEEFGEHGAHRIYNAHNYSLYDEMIRVPLIFRWPKGLEAGKRVQTTVQSADIVPTVFELLDLDPAAMAFDGLSLLPYIAGQEDPTRRVYSEATLDVLQRGLRSGQEKFIYQVDHMPLDAVEAPWNQYLTHRAWLFDLEKDPREQENLAPTSRRVETLRSDIDGVFEGAYSRRYEDPQVQVPVDGQLQQELRALGYAE